jgi:hypothetical protein
LIYGLIQEIFSARDYNERNFSFLFVKPEENAGSIEGRAYSIDLGQELILDHWEWYSDWYPKQLVPIRSTDGESHEAFVYTVDYAGKKLQEFKRIVNDPQKVIDSPGILG